MGGTEQFIARENIRRFKAQLASSTDERLQKVLRKLTAEQEQHLATARANGPLILNPLGVESRR